VTRAVAHAHAFWSRIATEGLRDAHHVLHDLNGALLGGVLDGLHRDVLCVVLDLLYKLSLLCIGLRQRSLKPLNLLRKAALFAKVKVRVLDHVVAALFRDIVSADTFIFLSAFRIDVL
jgi:hypothetical protein